MKTPKISPEEPVSALRHIPIRDNGEPLVEFTAHKIYWVPQHPVFDYQRFRLARRSVAEGLVRAAESLPAGLRLAIVEGWRPPDIQRQMHAATRERLRREYPDWTPQHLSRAANRFSAPMDPRVPPPHTTGGAVDINLVNDRGEILDLTSPYDIMDQRGAWANAPNLAPTARRNRELLREAMAHSVLTNYPAEWWHWSYGDQAWAYRGGHPEALYGAIEPENLKHADFTFHVRPDPGF